MGDVHTGMAYMCCCCLCGDNEPSTARRSMFGRTKKAQEEDQVEREMAGLDFTRDANGRFSNLRMDVSAEGNATTNTRGGEVKTEEPKPVEGMPELSLKKPPN
ncbi:hypothetical protein DL96DRAFT_1681583 [Flagelloscypha sp. PMI_526]|nr:hypothetical protein DL96DRAFT_1681583 [Flagelloscypha sp. PMI_526]